MSRARRMRPPTSSGRVTPAVQFERASRPRCDSNFKTLSALTLRRRRFGWVRVQRARGVSRVVSMRAASVDATPTRSRPPIAPVVSAFLRIRRACLLLQGLGRTCYLHRKRGMDSDPVSPARYKRIRCRTHRMMLDGSVNRLWVAIQGVRISAAFRMHTSKFVE
jgi:hypothetical protein